MSEITLAQKKALVLELFEINAFKFGDFKMKVGLNSPIYFDLRVIVSYPKVMKTVSNMIIAFMKEKKLTAKHVCGVPYTALPLATLVSVQENVPMLVRRKETKDYGTKKLIEGIFSKDDTCLIIEDVVTSGASIMETVIDLHGEGIVVNDVVVVVDRGQGGASNIARHGVNVHSIFKLHFLLETLLAADKIECNTVDLVTSYIKSCQINCHGQAKKPMSSEVVSYFHRTKLSFERRATLAKCEAAKSLFELMYTKKTNLCLAADVTKCQFLLYAAAVCGPFICMLKLHIDIIEDYTPSFLVELAALAKKHNFFIMEDRKFADIGNVMSQQYSKGFYKIIEWADFVTAHTISGFNVMQGLTAGIPSTIDRKTRGIFLVSEMSSDGNLIDSKYTRATNKIATESPEVDMVAGVVCQSMDAFTYPGLIQLTPGVRYDEFSDALGQQYNTPEFAVIENGADIAVVGRGILKSKCMKTAAASYRIKLWSSYEERIAKS